MTAPQANKVLHFVDVDLWIYDHFKHQTSPACGYGICQKMQYMPGEFMFIRSIIILHPISSVAC